MAKNDGNSTKESKEPNDLISEKVSWWQNYWLRLQSATDDSEEKLDGKTFTLSTGGIGLLLGLMGIGHESLTNGVWAAIVSLSAFAIALTINLLYYKLTIRNHNKHFKEIGDFIVNKKDDDKYLYSMIEEDDRKIDYISNISLALNILGIVFFGIYIVINTI